MTEIELAHQNFIPCVLAGTRTTRQCKQISAIANAACGTTLNRRCADLLHAHNREHRAKGIDLFFIDVAVCFNRHITPRQACATCADDNVNSRVITP